MTKFISKEDEKVRVLVYNVIGQPQVVYTDDFYGFQKIVQGNFEYADLGILTGFRELRGFDLFCNEEGHLRNLPVNRVFKNSVVLGNFIISKADELGEQISLTDEDILFIRRSIR